MLDHPPEIMGGLIREVFRAMIERVERQFDDSDMVLSQWLALKLIDTGTVSCIGDVTREVAIESGAATRMVDQLESRGLLVRRRSVTDRRVVLIFLTEQGKNVVTNIQPRLSKFWREELTIFSKEELITLVALLIRLRTKLSSPDVKKS